MPMYNSDGRSDADRYCVNLEVFDNATGKSLVSTAFNCSHIVLAERACKEAVATLDDLGLLPEHQ